MSAVRDSLVPQVMDALVAHAVSALPDVNVSDGYDGTNDPGDYLWVGVEDPFSASLTPAARTSQDWAGASRQTGRNESGDITCCIESWNGDGSVRDARVRCFAILAPVAAWARTIDGATVPGLFHAGVLDPALDQALTGEGAVARLVFRVHYEGRL